MSCAGNNYRISIQSRDYQNAMKYAVSLMIVSML